MSFQAYPTEPGTYRIKVYNTDKDHYWKYIQDRNRWVKLTKVDESEKPSSLSFLVSSIVFCKPVTTDGVRPVVYSSGRREAEYLHDYSSIRR